MKSKQYIFKNKTSGFATVVNHYGDDWEGEERYRGHIGILSIKMDEKLELTGALNGSLLLTQKTAREMHDMLGAILHHLNNDGGNTYEIETTKKN